MCFFGGGLTDGDVSFPHSHGNKVVVLGMFGQGCGSSQGQPSQAVYFGSQFITTVALALAF